jgi:hypothetical protein
MHTSATARVQCASTCRERVFLSVLKSFGTYWTSTTMHYFLTAWYKNCQCASHLQAFDLLDNLLCYDHHSRMTCAGEQLRHFWLYAVTMQLEHFLVGGGAV